MVRAEPFEPDYDVVPQAIFWRPLTYFATTIRQGEDDLDVFRAASFCIGNRARFDLRSYMGHPAFTVTLYLPFAMEDLEEIKVTIRLVIEEMAVPDQAVAWRRGQRYAFGELARPPKDRIREKEARVLVLKIAARCPHHSATTEYIKDNVPEYVELSKEDRRQSASRANEERWRQIVGNVVSHAGTATGPFATGYAELTGDGITVTDHGLAYLNNMGFSV